MATFNVFVEGPVDSMGLPELANAMSQRYGLPAAELVTRLQRGRFRVKSNLDASTAERYRRDLERIGARVVVEDTAKSPTATPFAGLPVQSRAPALSLPPIVAEQAAAVSPTKDPRTFTILGPQHTRDPGRPGTASQPPELARPSSVEGQFARPSSASEAPYTRPARPATVSTGPARPATASTAPAREPARPATVSTPPSALPPRATSQPSVAPQSVLPPRDAAQPLVAPQSVLPPRGPSQPSVAPQSALPPRGPAQPSVAPPSSGLSAAGNVPPARPSVPQIASGLSAAYTPATGHADLGALSSENAFSLASLDGHDDVPAAAMPREVPVAVVNIKPKATDAARAKPSPSKPMDLFAPPDAGDQELAVELADDEIAERAAKRASIPPATQPMAPSLSHRLATSQSQPLALPNEGGTSAAPKPFSREQFAIGVVLALVVGFLPAHFVASAREQTAFATLDRQLLEMQGGMDTPDTYAMIDDARAKFLDAKESKRSSIALQSMLLWAAVSAGVGFAFFRLRKS